MRIYGNAPYSVVVVHGGPGAPGSMAPVANCLQDEFGVLEPLQTASSVRGQVDELYNQIKSYSAPFIIIGHSWGSWLAWIFAARYPEMTKHIILVGSGPFDEEYVRDMMSTRLNNLEPDERDSLAKLLSIMLERELTKEEFSVFGLLMSKSDAYCMAESQYAEDSLPTEPEIYEAVWSEAAQMRKSGELVDLAEDIKCKITFIHGEFDPHPYKGIEEVLGVRGVDFEFILLNKCGHTPWKEKFYAEDFFVILKKLIKDDI